jgi:hypothetical protein
MAAGAMVVDECTTLDRIDPAYWNAPRAHPLLRTGRQQNEFIVQTESQRLPLVSAKGLRCVVRDPRNTTLLGFISSATIVAIGGVNVQCEWSIVDDDESMMQIGRGNRAGLFGTTSHLSSSEFSFNSRECPLRMHL